MLTVWRDICETALDDGIKFDGDALRADPIRERLDYGGLRLCMTTVLASARISITANIGFGDSVEPRSLFAEGRVAFRRPAATPLASYE